MLCIFAKKAFSASFGNTFDGFGVIVFQVFRMYRNIFLLFFLICGKIKEDSRKQKNGKGKYEKRVIDF